MSQQTLTSYLTQSGQLFISDSKGIMINHNMLNYDDFRREDKKITYNPERGRIRIEPLKNTSQNSQVPYEKIDSQTFQVTIKSTIDPDLLKQLIKRRRIALDESWEEYFRIGRLLTPYTTNGLEVPENIREEAERRLELLAENNPKTLKELLLI